MSPIRLALLECDTPPDPIKAQRGTYKDIFFDLLKASLFLPGVDFTLDGYDVVKAQVYPDTAKTEDEGGYRGILISGSGVYFVLHVMIF